MRDARYRQAALVYFVGGVLVMAITVFTPELAAPERREDLLQLLIGAPVFALFALAIAYLHRPVGGLLMLLRVSQERAMRWGLGARRFLALLLTISGTIRTFVFAANGIGYRPRASLSAPFVRMDAAEPAPRMLLCALIMGVIAAMLARAWWVGGRADT